jgi:hypothetical protein
MLACTPLRATGVSVPGRARRTGRGPRAKDERGVGYVKHNAVAGRCFASWAALEAHLAWWMREIADVRGHGTTGEAPRVRFERDEAAALKPLAGRPAFRQMRELVRRVQSDCAIELDTNAYSVPWRLIGETVRVVVVGGRVSIRHRGGEVAAHAETTGRRQRVVDSAHLAGIGRVRPAGPAEAPEGDTMAGPARGLASSELLRPLCEYERLVGGGW